MPALRGVASYKQAGVVGSRQHSPHSTFAHFAEPMSATFADRCELTCPLSTFTAFQGHFSFAFTAFKTGIIDCTARFVESRYV